MTTVEEFLRPPHGPEEFGHVLVSIFEDNHINHDSNNIFQNGQNHDADNTSENSQNHDTTNSHYSPLAEFIHQWTEFDVHRISLDPLITNSLSMPCEVRWEPQVPTFARIIYSERQLEALYLQTLITRVNIALDKAIPSTEDRIAIVVGPGAFENVSPEATAKTLIPDWIVVQGKFNIGLDADALPILKDLAAKRKILAVGDTKLVRQRDRKPKVPYTNACHRDFLRQVQDYCLNLYTRFGFILSNEELVVAKFERAQDSSPRKPNQRGLRSNGAQLLVPGLDSQGSDVPAPADGGDDLRSRDDHLPKTPGSDDPYQLPPFATPAQATPGHVPSKRPYSTSPETSHTSAAPRMYQRGHSHSGSDAGNSGPRQILSDPASSSQDHSVFAPSDRDVDVGAIHIRSIDMMGWGEDNFDMMDWEEEKKESPYKALFMFVMMVRAFKQGGNTLEI
ncbi:hypothetical protein T069G_03688 [Trichoderma breve]|uniref:Uncharacterized protein n=1 Tax=Trichoderma breve TaxID=2034170 RepID=A0A9W9BJZ4_9HYPO|nr:hypothetical protein T069G_03688 [Trichoderma breve]KAJ4862734.1 hypothetical protein T069G_03688 [Trichoderma breve]